MHRGQWRQASAFSLLFLIVYYYSFHYCNYTKPGSNRNYSVKTWYQHDVKLRPSWLHAHFDAICRVTKNAFPSRRFEVSETWSRVGGLDAPILVIIYCDQKQLYQKFCVGRPICRAAQSTWPTKHFVSIDGCAAVEVPKLQWRMPGWLLSLQEDI